MTILFSEGFESDTGWTHNVRVFPVGGDSYNTQDGSIFTPKNWLFWYKHQADTWDIPEARYCWKSADPHRIKSGDGAHMFFSFWRRHDAGYMRKVTVTPGDTLRLTAWAHAWSNHNLEGHEDCTDDGRCSCGVGRQVIAIAAEDVPALNGDPWNDAIGNSMFTIGIDPYGGEDPFSANVVWGDAYAIYNGYAKQLVVETEAVGTVATVFLRNVTLWPFKHNDAYWDDVVLEAISLPDGRGDPRVQYARTYVLMPPSAGKAWVIAATEATWDDRRYTIGGSADDAGIGNLDSRRVIAVNPAGWPSDLKAFFETYYPGVEYVPVIASTPEALRLLLTDDQSNIALWQCDPRWADKDLGEDPGGETICEAGCLLTSYAMCLRHAGCWIYPDELNTILAEDGVPFTNDDFLTNWGAAVELFDEFEDSCKANAAHSASALKELLAGGWEIILRHPGGTHFVYLESVSDDNCHIIDPWDGERKVKPATDYEGIRGARRAGTSPPPSPVVGPLVSLHLQTLVEGVFEFVSRVKPNVVKVFQLEVAKEIKARSPDTEVVLRYYTPNQNLDGDLEAAAKAYVRSFEDSLRVNAGWIDYVESWNETIATHDIDGIKRAVEFDCHFADALMALGLPVAPQLLNVAVGNPYHTGLRAGVSQPALGPPPSMGFLGIPLHLTLLAVSEIELMLPTVRQVIKYGGTLGYHAYGQAINGSNLNDNWKYFAGRALENWDPVFRSQGLYPRYIFGECGAFATCNDGWRASNCLGGDWPKYLAQLTEFSNRIKAWNATHGNRCLGGTLFTTGGFGWDSFEIGKAETEDPNWPT